MSNYSKEPFIPYDVIYDLYVVQKKSMNVISKELGCAVGTVFNYSKKYGIDPRHKKDNRNLMNFIIPLNPVYKPKR